MVRWEPRANNFAVEGRYVLTRDGQRRMGDGGVANVTELIGVNTTAGKEAEKQWTARNF